MKKFLSLILCGCFLLALSSCGEKAPEKAEFFAMDTAMSLTVYDGGDACARIKTRALSLDSALSTTDPSGALYRLNEAGSASLDGDTLALVIRSLTLSFELSGYFDPTVYPAVCEWGFISGDYTIPSDERLNELAAKIDSTEVTVDGSTVTLPDGVMLDLGAAAKGYLADECRSILSDCGASCAILNLGGTICLYGKKSDGSPFKVGVADPENPSSYFGFLSCGEGVLATSGGYERYFEKDGKRYIHILDPETARPVDNGVLSVTIFCHDGVLSDVLSTALFVMGEEKAAACYRDYGGFEYILLTQDHRLYLSEGIADSFTLTADYPCETIRIAR